MNTIHKYIPLLKAIAMSSLLLLLLSFADGDNLKLWSPGDKLVWSDFQATPPPKGGIQAALTNTTVRLNFDQMSERTFTINVVTAMDRSRSWVYPNEKTDYILSHEQCHFDITEYWGRRMRKDLINAKYTIKNIKTKVGDIQKSNIQSLKEMQEQYDGETKHSIVHDKQAQWEKKVAGLLEEVKDYSNPNVTVMVK